MTTKLLLASFVLLLTTAVLGQGSIGGKVVSDTKEILPGAHIFVQETRAVAIADREGNFIIRDVANGTYTLTVSFIGYEALSTTVEVKNGTHSHLKIFLKAGDVQLS